METLATRVDSNCKITFAAVSVRNAASLAVWVTGVGVYCTMRSFTMDIPRHSNANVIMCIDNVVTLESSMTFRTVSAQTVYTRAFRNV